MRRKKIYYPEYRKEDAVKIAAQSGLFLTGSWSDRDLLLYKYSGLDFYPEELLIVSWFSPKIRNYRHLGRKRFEFRLNRRTSLAAIKESLMNEEHELSRMFYSLSEKWKVSFRYQMGRKDTVVEDGFGKIQTMLLSRKIFGPPMYKKVSFRAWLEEFDDVEKELSKIKDYDDEIMWVNEQINRALIEGYVLGEKEEVWNALRRRLGRPYYSGKGVTGEGTDSFEQPDLPLQEQICGDETLLDFE